jgi:hypothetical protein
LEVIWEYEALENTELARDSAPEPANSGQGISNFRKPRQEGREKSFGSLFGGEDNVHCWSKDDSVDGEVNWDDDQDKDEEESQDEEEYDEERDDTNLLIHDRQ